MGTDGMIQVTERISRDPVYGSGSLIGQLGNRTVYICISYGFVDKPVGEPHSVYMYILRAR